jgi:hypothetical protein
MKSGRFPGREFLGKSCEAAGIDGLGVAESDRAARETGHRRPEVKPRLADSPTRRLDNSLIPKPILE